MNRHDEIRSWADRNGRAWESQGCPNPEIKTNYERLFGTPERAARTVLRSTPLCADCILRDDCRAGEDDGCCLTFDERILLGWLKSGVGE